MIELGKKYKDSLTGFEGIATARATYLYGCVRVLLEAKSKSNVKPEEYWFDEQRLDIPTKAATKNPGGPGPIAPRRDPS